MMKTRFKKRTADEGKEGRKQKKRLREGTESKRSDKESAAEGNKMMKGRKENQKKHGKDSKREYWERILRRKSSGEKNKIMRNYIKIEEVNEKRKRDERQIREDNQPKQRERERGETKGCRRERKKE